MSHIWTLNPKKKNPKMIIDLIKRNNKASREQLKKISQSDIWNATYELKFGAHNKTGIHGAVPWDLLHWIRLNWFKNTRDCLFEQTGETSKLSKSVDALCIVMGRLLKRQSFRKMPRTLFNSGIREPTLQATHMPGVMIVLTLLFRSSQGSNVLLTEARGSQKRFFRNQNSVRDWSTLVEDLLMMEAWLRKDEFNPVCVERFKIKIKEVMSMMRAVGQRQTGMGDKRGIFHGALHMPEMILNFGAPKHYDTDNNESDHKADKKSSKRTQQRGETFDLATATKIKERHAVELGMHEIKTGKSKWHYYRRLGDDSESDSDSDSDDDAPNMEPFDPILAQNVEFRKQLHPVRYIPYKAGKKVDKNLFKFDNQLFFYLEKMAHLLEPVVGPLQVYGELKIYAPHAKKGRQIYRATPDIKGTPWYDWAMFLGDPLNNGSETYLGQMKCFVDLRHVPEERPDNVPEPGIYTVVEIASISAVPGEQRKSDLWEAWVKKDSNIPLFAGKNRLHLTHIDKILSPEVVVPDLGNENRRAYLRMVSTDEWADMFDDWLKGSHYRDWN